MDSLHPPLYGLIAHKLEMHNDYLALKLTCKHICRALDNYYKRQERSVDYYFRYRGSLYTSVFYWRGLTSGMLIGHIFEMTTGGSFAVSAIEHRIHNKSQQEELRRVWYMRQELMDRKQKAKPQPVVKHMDGFLFL